MTFLISESKLNHSQNMDHIKNNITMHCVCTDVLIKIISTMIPYFQVFPAQQLLMPEE